MGETEADARERREGYWEGSGQRGKPEAVGKLADQIWVRRKGGMFGEGKLGGRRSKDREGKSRGTARESSWGPDQNGQSLLPLRV